MKDLLELVAKKLVEHPEDMSIRVVESEDGACYELRVHPDDMGKVIGRSGRTAKAIRTVLSAAASKTGARVTLQIVE